MNLKYLKENIVLAKVNSDNIKNFKECNPDYEYCYQRGQTEIPTSGYLGVFQKSKEWSVISEGDERISKYKIVNYVNQTN